MPTQIPPFEGGPAASAQARTEVGKRSVGDIVEGLPLRRAHIMLLCATLAGFLFDSFDTTAMAVGLRSVTAEFKVDAVTGGILGSAAFWGMGLGALFFGPAADRIGRRMAMIVSILGYSLFTGVAAFSQNPAQLFACRLLVGIFVGALIPIDLVYLGEMAPLKHRGFFLAIIGCTWPIGMFLAALAGLYVLPVLGWRPLFLIGALPALAAFWVWFSVPESPRWLLKTGKPEEAVKALQRLGADVKSPAEIYLPEEEKAVGMIATLGIVFSAGYRRRMICSFGMFFFHMIASYGYDVWMPTILATVLHINVQKTMKYTMIIYACNLVGRSIAVWTMERVNRRHVFMFAEASMAALALLLALMVTGRANEFVFMALAMVYAVLTNIYVLQMWVPEMFPSEVRASATCWATVGGRIGAGIGPMIFGVIMAAGVYYMAYLAIAVWELFAVSIPAFFLKVETRGKSLKDVGAE
jgi:putative MFS transporter